jgi:hypothetical protein
VRDDDLVAGCYQAPADRRLRPFVERARGLVEVEDARGTRDGPRDEKPLLLAAGDSIPPS